MQEKILSLEKQNAPEEEINELVQERWRQRKGRRCDNGNIMSGQIAGLVNKEQSAAEIIEEMFKEEREIYEDRNSICRAGSAV